MMRVGFVTGDPAERARLDDPPFHTACLPPRVLITASLFSVYSKFSHKCLVHIIPGVTSTLEVTWAADDVIVTTSLLPLLYARLAAALWSSATLGS